VSQGDTWQVENVTHVTNIIVVCHWTSNVSYEAFLITNFNKLWGGVGWGGAWTSEAKDEARR
jgi:hypothetical protein